MTRRAVCAGLLVFVVALVVRVAYIHEYHRDVNLDVSRLSQTDNHVFAAWARTIAAGDLLCREQPHAWHLWTSQVAPPSTWLAWFGGERTFHQSPLYPYVVAAVYATLGDGHAIIGYVQAVLSAFTCLLTFLLARRLLPLPAAAGAGLLLALCGSFVFYDAFILRDGLMALLVVVLALALDGAVARDRGRDWLVAGAALGLFTLAKETGPALLVLALIGAAWWRRATPRVALARCALLVAGWLVLVTPAFARNLAVDAPAFRLSTRGPEVFIAGNAAGQDGVSWDPPIALTREILIASDSSLSGTIARTLATHRSDPLGYLALLWAKAKALFHGYEVPNNVNFYQYRSHLETLRVTAVTSTFLAPAALLGLLLALPRRRRLAVVYLLFLALAASIVGLYVLARFRLQLLPLMAVFAGYTVHWIWTAVAERRRGAAVAVTGALALLIAWAWPPPEAFTDVNKHAAFMIMHLTAGDVGEARRFQRQYHAALAASADVELGPDGEDRLAQIDDALVAFEEVLRQADGAGRLRALGDAYAMLLPVTKRAQRRGIEDLARWNYQQALAADPATAGVHHGLARLALAAGLRDQAWQELLLELDIDPDHGPSQRELGLLYFEMEDWLPAVRHLEHALRLGEDAPLLVAIAGRARLNTALRGRPVPLGGGVVIDAFDPQAGLERVERALAAAPDDPDVMREAALSFLAGGQILSQAALLDRATRLFEQLRDLQESRAAEYDRLLAGARAARERLAEAPAGG